MKRGPTDDGRMAEYASMATTGHSLSPVLPRYKVIPAPNWSVLLCRKLTAMIVGDEWESTLISVVCRKTCRDGHVNSPARMKPKKPRQNAAQSMMSSNVGCLHDHVSWILLRISRVIVRHRSRTQAGPFLLTPFRA